MERKALGRGLDALIQAAPEAKERVQTLNISQIKASRFQPRLHFSEEKIDQLANSIREKGVIQPILVRPAGDGRYELIAGERRFRAVKQLGLSEIPVIVRQVADADLLEISIIENIQREELNVLEEAKAYQRLAQEFGYAQDHIANRVGKDKSSISNLLRLLNLPDEIQNFLSKNMISFGHARALLSVLDKKRQLFFCKAIIEKGLSVRQIEALTSGQIRKTGKQGRALNLTKDIEIRSLEEKLQQILGTKVRLRHGKKRGKIEIEYYSLEDLDRLLKLFGVSST